MDSPACSPVSGNRQMGGCYHRTNQSKVMVPANCPNHQTSLWMVKPWSRQKDTKWISQQKSRKVAFNNSRSVKLKEKLTALTRQPMTAEVVKYRPLLTTSYPNHRRHSCFTAGLRRVTGKISWTNKEQNTFTVKVILMNMSITEKNTHWNNKLQPFQQTDYFGIAIFPKDPK